MEQSEKSLKEQFAEEEARLTPEELERLKHAKEELMAKWLIIGGFWGAVIGALVGHFLLDTDWMTGIYTGLPVGLLAGVAGGWIFGALEKAMLLEHVGHYARPEQDGEQDAPQELDDAQPAPAQPDTQDTADAGQAEDAAQ